MRLMLLLGCLLVCSCSKDSTSAPDDAPPLISGDETRKIAMHVLLNRYPHAEIVSETVARTTAIYRFATNGITVPLSVVVDRQAGKAKFEPAPH
jgi:hypothetical protein